MPYKGLVTLRFIKWLWLSNPAHDLDVPKNLHRRSKWMHFEAYKVLKWMMISKRICHFRSALSLWAWTKYVFPVLESLWNFEFSVSRNDLKFCTLSSAPICSFCTNFDDDMSWFINAGESTALRSVKLPAL